MAALLQRLDAFTSAAAMAQALPALHGRSYLDIASMQCKEELGRSWGQGGGKGQGGWHRAGTDATVVAVLVTDTLTPLALEPLPVGPGNMMVRLVVECPVPPCPQHLLYDLPVPVPTGASLLDLLGAAPAQGPQNFTCVTPRAGGDPDSGRGLPPCPLPPRLLAPLRPPGPSPPSAPQV